MAARGASERRVRLGVWAGFELPDLGLAASAPVARRLDARYYDTPDLRLLRRGIMVRHADAAWTVRRTGDEPLLGVDAPAGEVPAPIAALTVAWTLGEPLVPVARLATARRAVTLRDGERDVAALADDEVSLLRGERVAARFRELDLEAVNGAPPGALDRLERRLREAGAQPVDPVPKVVRGLAPTALEPLPQAPATGPDATVAEAVRARLASSLATWVDEHAALALEGSPESVRGVRSAVRALRRDLRVLAPAVEARAGLGRVADALTPVRRLDQLLERAGDELPRPLRARLAVDRAEALAGASASLGGERYAAALRDVARLAERPPLASRATRPAAEALPRLVREPLRRVRRAAPEDPERLRTLVDRLSAAVRLAAPFAGADARRAERAVAELRALLHAHHDALTAIESLRALAARAPEHAWAAGMLAGRESALAAERRDALPYAFERATRRRLWAWVP
jgi:inorganic triphosphatase YgiF